ncbi:MAG: hypothetical protein E6I56_03515 [Chloroflexi bacterium]|nr:MAG: hypothetical protein E6I56_03515 [Chloroflexota bacterium]
MTTYFIWALLALLALGQPGTRGPVMAPSEVLGVHAGADGHGLQGKVYVALGDSISAGRYATAQDDTFPYVIADKLGMNLDLVARSGTKAAWGVAQLAAVNVEAACDRHGGIFVSLEGFYAVNAFHAADGGSSYLGRADWFHPGDQGHAAIAAAVLSALGAGPAPVLAPIPSAPPVTDVIRTHPH